MVVIVGLGNPGEKYINTWHNLGFLVVNNLQENVSGFSNWIKEKKFQAEISEGKFNNKEILLVKPFTFMNNSGKAVKSLTKTYRVKFGDLIVVHDDIDLPLGKIKIVKNRGAAGHKGIESITKELKVNNFIRFRIGIQPKTGKPKKTEAFVLKKINNKEAVKTIIQTTTSALKMSQEESLEKVMNVFNR